MTTRILVAFHSVTGKTAALAHEVAAGAAGLARCSVELRRIADVSGREAILGPVLAATPEPAPGVALASAADLAAYDGIAIGTPVYFGSMSSAVRLFLDQTGRQWLGGELIGTPATVFCAAGSGGGRELAIASVWFTLAVHGMTIVPPGLRERAVIDAGASHGGSPIGAGTLASAPGERPSDAERAIARAQGRALAEVARAWRERARD
ncbi:MAG: NAD(P)H:quinone oxidoreductase [Burkholderiales bacterium]|nr:NAD(P)H:quinone oxidoreductase [Burkholderiales bacterium]